jgi:glycosyltransferase involved in cell wall biosynthesis
LIEAFAQVADLLPEWQVKLVGTVQASFKGYLSAFFEEFPKLKERIILMGTINNRRDLIREYQQAKIFALTSRLEGGTPNVVAEALFCGCYQVLTNFDAANEAIDKGKCGVVVENQEELIQQLLILGKNPSRLLAGEKDALKLAKTNYDFEKLIQRLHYLLFKGETNADF